MVRFLAFYGRGKEYVIARTSLRTVPVTPLFIIYFRTYALNVSTVSVSPSKIVERYVVAIYVNWIIAIGFGIFINEDVVYEESVVNILRVVALGKFPFKSVRVVCRQLEGVVAPIFCLEIAAG